MGGVCKENENLLAKIEKQYGPMKCYMYGDMEKHSIVSLPVALSLHKDIGIHVRHSFQHVNEQMFYWKKEEK